MNTTPNAFAIRAFAIVAAVVITCAMLAPIAATAAQVIS